MGFSNAYRLINPALVELHELNSVPKLGNLFPSLEREGIQGVSWFEQGGLKF